MIRYCDNCNCATHQKMVYHPHNQMFYCECKNCHQKNVFGNAYTYATYSENMNYVRQMNAYWEGRVL